jgi:hypothetical protein
MGGGGKSLNTKDTKETLAVWVALMIWGCEGWGRKELKHNGTKGTKETLAGLAVCGFDDPGL